MRTIIETDDDLMPETMALSSLPTKRAVNLGAFGIAHGHALLRDDRDFDLMPEYLGLQIA